LPGISEDHGANNPLLSAHPGGAVSLFADGSVRFLTEDTDIVTLKRFATRNDDQIENH
jgi:prepilin-type processing-associated H-X9-DG protein